MLNINYILYLSISYINFNIFNQYNVCIFGLGYVGLTLGVHISQSKFQVFGCEISDHILDSLKNKKAHFFEKNFNENLTKVVESGRFKFGKNYIRSKKTIYIITVGTPLDENNNKNNIFLENVTSEIFKLLDSEDIVILRSTVSIGTSENIYNILSKKDKNFYLAFAPERTIEGNALEELSALPQIIGGIDDKSTKIVGEFFKILGNEVVLLKNTKSAEMVKLMSNVYRDIQFCIANEIEMI